MEAKVDEIGDRIFRISAFMPHVLSPQGLTFNQFPSPATAPTIRGLAQFQPRLLAVMHGSSFSGDPSKAMNDLAACYASWIMAEMDAGGP